MKTLAILICTILQIGFVSAHQDTPLQFKNGKIEGLPKKYLPASFDVKTQSLSLAGKKLVFPDMLKRLFTYDASLEVNPFNDAPPDIKVHPYTYKFSASWYHDQIASGLPPYILIIVTHPDEKTRFEILVSMDGMKLLRADVIIKDVGQLPINLGESTDNPKSGQQGGGGQPATRRDSK